jgi:hypothetical protein
MCDIGGENYKLHSKYESLFCKFLDISELESIKMNFTGPLINLYFLLYSGTREEIDNI